MKRIALLPFLVFIFFLTSLAWADFSKEAGAEDSEVFRTEVIKLLAKRDIEGLEKLHDLALKSNTSYSDGTIQFSIFYYELARFGTEEERNALVRDWKKAKPQSAAPYTLNARLLIRNGWNLRGGGFVEGKSESVMQAFAAEIERALAEIVAAKPLPNRDPEFYRCAVEVFGLLGAPKNVIDSAFSDGIAQAPLSLDLYQTRVNFLRPEWGGSAEEVQKFAEESAKKTAKLSGDGMYFFVVHTVRQLSGDRLFERYPFSWERVKKGYRDFDKKFPKSFYSKAGFLNLAFASGDRKTAKSLTDKLGPAFDSRLPDMDESQYTALVRWANGEDFIQEPPLHSAVRQRNRKLVENLLANGANPNEINGYAQTPLTLAIQHDPELVPLLLQKGAKIGVTMIGNLTEADIAVSTGDLATLRILLQAGASVYSGFHIAVRESRLEILEELFKSGKKPFMKIDGKSLMTLAIEENKIDAAKLLIASQAAKMNDATSVDLPPPLHEAVFLGKPEMVKMFLESGADPNLSYGSHGTAFDVARAEHPELLKVLLEKSPDNSTQANMEAAKKLPHPLFKTAGQNNGVAHMLVLQRQKAEWKKLTAEHDEWMKSRERTPEGISRVADFYSWLKHCPLSPQVCMEDLDAWSLAEPGNGIPEAAKAMVGIDRYLRELKVLTAAKKSKKDIEKTLLPIAEDAWKQIQKAVGLEKKDPEMYASAIVLADFIKKDEQVVLSFLESGKQLDPTYERLWIAAGHYYMNRGQKEKIAPLLESAASPEFGDGLYALVGTSFAEILPDKQFTELRLDWKRRRKGYEDLLKVRPGDAVQKAKFLLAARKADDRGAARRAIRLLGNKANTEILSMLGDERQVENLMLWAKGTEGPKMNLVSAVIKGDQDAALEALESGERIDTIDGKGRGILHVALEKSPKMLPWLIEQGAPVGLCPNGTCIIDTFIERNLLEALSAVANSDFRMNGTGPKGTPLELAIALKKPKAVREILKSKDIEFGVSTQPGKKNEFEQVIDEGQSEILEMMARHPKATLNPTTSHPNLNSSPLIYAIRAKKPEMVKILLEQGASPHHVVNGVSPIAMAKEGKDARILALLEMPEKKGKPLTPLNPVDIEVSQAVLKGDVTLVKKLINEKFPKENGPSAGVVTERKLDPANGYTAVHLATSLGNLEMVKLLLKNSEYLDLVTWESSSPGVKSTLLLAVIEDRTEIVNYLLQWGVSPQQTAFTGAENPEQYVQRTKRTKYAEIFKNPPKRFSLMEMAAILKEDVK